MKAYPRIVQEEPGGPVLLKLWIEGRDVVIPLSDGEQRELCRALVEIVIPRPEIRPRAADTPKGP